MLQIKDHQIVFTSIKADGTFTGTDVGPSNTTWTSNWGDIDNDGDLDLITIGLFGSDGYFWKNDGNGNLSDATSELSSIFPLQTNGSNSNGAIFVDYNNDGRLDIYIAQPNTSPDLLMKNTTEDCNAWLLVESIGTLSNRSAIGAVLSLKAQINGQATWMKRQVSSQTSKPGSNPLWSHFGLGDATQVDSLIIDWPSGEQCVFTNLPVNQFLEITEDCETNLVSGTSASDLAFCTPSGDTLLTHPSGESGQWSGTCDATAFKAMVYSQ